MATTKKTLDDYFEDESFDSLQKTRHGKKPNQKLKPYLVLQILMEHTDEEHVLCADKIVDYLILIPVKTV